MENTDLKGHCRGDRYNGEGYYDPTAYEAIANIESQYYKERKKLAYKVIETLFNVAHLAGFDIVGDITLRDHKTREIVKGEK